MSALTAVHARPQVPAGSTAGGSSAPVADDFGALLAAECCPAARAQTEPADDVEPAVPAVPLLPAPSTPTLPAGDAGPAAPPAAPAVAPPDAALTVPPHLPPGSIAPDAPATRAGTPATATAQPILAAPAAAPPAAAAPTPALTTVPSPTARAPRADEPTTSLDATLDEALAATERLDPAHLPPAAAPAAPPATGAGAVVPAPPVDLAAALPSAPPAQPVSVEAAPTPAPAPAAPAPAATQVLSALGPALEGPDGSYSMSLQLYPEELGAVQVEISLRNGELSLALRSPDAEAVEVLRAAVADLRTQLESTGLRSADVSVDLGQGSRREQAEQRSPADRTRPGDAAGAVPADEPSTTASAGDSALDVRI